MEMRDFEGCWHLYGRRSEKDVIVFVLIDSKRTLKQKPNEEEVALNRVVKLLLRGEKRCEAYQPELREIP